MDIVFGKTWFERNQKKLLWFLNTPIIRVWFRYCLRINNKQTINRITPNSYTFGGEYTDFETVELTTEFRTHDKYAKRLYHAFKYIWWTMHFFDWLVLDRFLLPSFGFTTLTVYPDTGNPGAVSVDGSINRNVGDTVWSTCRDATTGAVSDATSTTGRFIISWLIGGSDYSIRRGFFHFDTSSLDDSATISSAVFSLAGEGTAETNTNSSSIYIVESTAASANQLVSGDYDNVGSTSFASMLLANWVQTDGTYNDFTLNASGISNISKTGVSKFATRDGRDFDNLAPTGLNTAYCHFADQTGTSKDPKLVITYTVVVGPANLKSYNTNASANIKSIDTNAIANIKSLNTNV